MSRITWRPMSERHTAAYDGADRYIGYATKIGGYWHGVLIPASLTGANAPKTGPLEASELRAREYVEAQHFRAEERARRAA